MWIKGWLDDMADCYHLFPDELWIDDDDGDRDLDCDLCREALAAYDARYTIVETSELERLRALEQRISDFLEHMTSGNAIDDPIEFGGVRIEWAKSGGDYGLWIVSRPGDAAKAEKVEAVECG